MVHRSPQQYDRPHDACGGAHKLWHRHHALGRLEGITAGADGNLWFTETTANKVGRITPTGVVTEFSTGITAGATPFAITRGADGNVWFSERFGGIGRITPAGIVTEFTAGISATPGSEGIAAGPDGNVWFTERNNDVVGRITPTGAVTEFSTGISPFSAPIGIAAGPDCNLWFTEANGPRIARITPAGAVTEFANGITVDAFPTFDRDRPGWESLVHRTGDRFHRAYDAARRHRPADPG